MQRTAPAGHALEMLIQPVPCIAVVVAILQTVHFGHAPVYQGMDMIGLLVPWAVESVFLISRNADVFKDIILFSERAKKAFTRYILQLGCTPAHTRASPAITHWT